MTRFDGVKEMDEEEYDNLNLSDSEIEVMTEVFKSRQKGHHLHLKALGQEVSGINSRMDKNRLVNSAKDLVKKDILMYGKQGALRFTPTGKRAYNYQVVDDLEVDIIL